MSSRYPVIQCSLFLLVISVVFVTPCHIYSLFESVLSVRQGWSTVVIDSECCLGVKTVGIHGSLSVSIRFLHSTCLILYLQLSRLFSFLLFPPYFLPNLKMGYKRYGCLFFLNAFILSVGYLLAIESANLFCCCNLIQFVATRVIENRFPQFGIIKPIFSMKKEFY